MPFEIKKTRGEKPYAVVTKGTGKVHGRFHTKAEARSQQKALYSNIPEARGGK